MHKFLMMNLCIRINEMFRAYSFDHKGPHTKPPWRTSSVGIPKEFLMQSAILPPAELTLIIG